MQTAHASAAVLVILSCAFVGASCVQASEWVPETGDGAAGAPALERADEGDIGSEPPTDIGFESPPPPIVPRPGGPAFGDRDEPPSDGPEGWFLYKLCISLKGGPMSARVAFCGARRGKDVRERCYSHLHDSPVSWQGWCYNEFNRQ